jgi:hypothetical protein
MLSLQLDVEGANLGALNLYARGPGSFDDESEHVGLLFASHAAVAFVGIQSGRPGPRPPLLLRRVLNPYLGLFVGSAGWAQRSSERAPWRRAVGAGTPSRSELGSNA